MALRSRFGRFLLMEGPGPAEGEDLHEWLAEASARMEHHGDRANRDPVWAALLLAVGAVLAFSGLADALLKSVLPSHSISGAVAFVPGTAVGIIGGWHAGRMVKVSNAIRRALGGKVQFWTAYRVGAVLLALAILAQRLRG